MDYRKTVDILLKQMASLIDAKLKSLTFDETFGSVIKEVGEKGNYKIIKNGQLYEVKNATDIHFKVGQSVWVKVPCGNLNNMHICGMR